MILVTGGAGFIGSALIYELNRRGQNDILVVDRLEKGSKWLNLRGLRYERYIHADELFLPQNEKTLFGVERVFHLGACSDTLENDMDFLMKNNVEYSMKLFEWSAQQEIKMVYASSAATYGDGAQGYDDDHARVGQLRPLNPYGYSKQVFDQWVLKRKRHPPLWFGLKFFNVYGPNEYHKNHMSSVIYSAFQQIKKDGTVRLFKSYRSDIADGEQKRDFIYVKDVVNVMLDLMDLPLPNGKGHFSGIYNVGSGKARSFNELAKAVFMALDRAPHIDYIEMPDHLKSQYQYFTEASMTKLTQLITHWQVRELEAGVQDYVKFYLNRPDHYLSIA